jgi:predicted MFS family arabinose efflux permease
MMPLSVFRNRVFAIGNLYTFFLYAALGGSLFYVPFVMQNIHGYSSTAAGAAMLPFIVTMFLASRWSGGLVARIGARTPLVFGAVLASFGFIWYAAIGSGGPYLATFFPAALLLGCGGALFVAPLTTTVMSALDPTLAGIASGINNAVSRIAGLLAIAALGIVVAAAFYQSYDQALARLRLHPQTLAQLRLVRASLATGHVPDQLVASDRGAVQDIVQTAYVAGFRRAMSLSAISCWLAAALAFFGLPKDAPPATNADEPV